MLGYAVLQLALPPSTILLTQASLHAVAACVSCYSCSAHRHGGRERLREAEDGVAQPAIEMEEEEDEPRNIRPHAQPTIKI